ncbi:carbamoyltransferase C-terminal domain-containing protein [Specibacter sp. NPDC078709]|uniref:carbamoyltransferase C-terminal domain-containing protein n=1 Tax=Specibacter sp. NPDC078709 TaxID=3154364 RepID=UPI00342C40F9
MVTILGLWSDHDSSYAWMKNGEIQVHEEIERFVREKEVIADSFAFFESASASLGFGSNIDWIVSCYPSTQLIDQPSWPRLARKLAEGTRFEWVGHHRAHAAHAYFSSPGHLQNALIVSVDGGGYERDGTPLTSATALSFWHGLGHDIRHLETVPLAQSNIGSVWTRTTRHVFGLSSGWPSGDQAGSVMAMAALSDGGESVGRFMRALTEDLAVSSGGMGEDLCAEYWAPLRLEAESSSEARNSLAAGLQLATERLFLERLDPYIRMGNFDGLCIAGGVALNSVMMGRIAIMYPHLEVFIPPVPYDGGLAIGAAQYVWHALLGNERITGTPSLTPFLGREYSVNEEAAIIRGLGSRAVRASDAEVVRLIALGNIVGVFSGRSESGRRALGNRSILADPRDGDVQERLNARKHRASYRPFAPAVLVECVQDYFGGYGSDYMALTVPASSSMIAAAPGALHSDETGRLQIVTPTNAPRFYDLISEFRDLTGVGALLNTSLNDSEPICENLHHALRSLDRGVADFLYLPSHGVVVCRSSIDAQ